MSNKPIIHCFVNTNPLLGDIEVVAMAEDGTVLGSHISSSVNFAQADIGYKRGTYYDKRHACYAEHYPDGYELVWVDYGDFDSHIGLQAAITRNRIQHGETVVDFDGEEQKNPD